MKLSPFFYDLRSAYQAELDDLVSDSEGKDVLRKRLAEKRAEMGFLVQMMDLAPEMVAVAFHKAFRFVQADAMERLLAQGRDELPDWHSLGHAVALEPWAQSLAQTVLREPQGARFLAVAAGLEYLQQHARLAPAAALHDDDDAEDEGADTAEHDDDYNALSADDAVEPQNSRTREEAGAEWLADAGFDRKE
ncbi:MAG: hypothetical protein LWW96_08465 [Acidovorax sp.]|uniref:hypothetical protein n=1 Tax=Acidovorax sp. TaxID=1872122 RepID=UPI0025C14C90|nr:hypothetical protein [Acidovorax sp.]MCE1192171.1 hypothetical protein [Acidovorax sp.]